ncbi:MAG: FCD domain-containing protein [Parasphingorhabdus sp.]|nr:FCD domain-containing protein [Parasphingorhabdus sp.]
MPKNIGAKSLNLSTLKTAEVVARTIVHDICDQSLSEGDRLMFETAMRSEYSAGRASVREGLRLLEAQGLVTLKAGRYGGAFVGNTSPDHAGRMLTLFLQMLGATYEDVAICQQILAPKAAELAAQNPDRELVSKSLALAARSDGCKFVLSENVDQDNLMNFHRTLSSLCGNPVLALLIDTVESIIVNHIIHCTPPEDRMTWVHSDHEDIAKAILAGDGPLAWSLHNDHLKNVLDHYRRQNFGQFSERVEWR